MKHPRNLKSVPFPTRAVTRLLGLVITLFTLFTLIFLFAESLGWTDETWIRDHLDAMVASEAGTIGTAIVVGLLLAADLFLPVPSSILMTFSGYLFGPVGGTLLNFAGGMVSAWVGFELCRRFGSAAFQRLIGDEDVDDVSLLIERYGTFVIVLSRSVPMLTEVVSCVAGLGGMARRRFLTWSAVGTLPVCVAYAVAGNSSHQSALGWSLLIAFLLPGLGFLAVVLWQRRRQKTNKLA